MRCTHFIALGLTAMLLGGAPSSPGEQAVTPDSTAQWQHWAYLPVRTTIPPTVKDSSWPAGPVDRFILEQIEAKGLRPAIDAPRSSWLRRVTFDLTGLPPTPEELDAFESDNTPGADAKVVDRLLVSRRFGEHWARHWLDGVRYNPQFETVTRYRDWVTQAFNADLPYDEFLTRQLAGDLLPAGDDPKSHDDNIIATQMLSLNAKEMDPVEGMIEVVGHQILASSINCAKCHDHKFDPFTQKDYYALAGIFTSSQITPKKGNAAQGGVMLRNEPGTRILAMGEGNVGDTTLLIRGERDKRGPVIERRFPIVLAGDHQVPIAQLTHGSGRLELARWIASPANPLTARVIVNRVWMHLTGLPIVATPNDFGARCNRPIHAELLDYLADDFVRSGWSVKALVRRIALSRTYRQSTHTTTETRLGDPTNQLMSRMPIKRLSYEQIVDSLTFTAGLLQDMPPVPMKKENQYAFSGKGQTCCRTLYQDDARTGDLFDRADPELLTERREASVTAPQMLFFLNNSHVDEAAGLLARRAERTAGSVGSSAAVRSAYRILFARSPSEREAEAAAQYLQRRSLPDFCHVLICSNEFIYLD